MVFSYILKLSRNANTCKQYICLTQALPTAYVLPTYRQRLSNRGLDIFLEPALPQAGWRACVPAPLTESAQLSRELGAESTFCLGRPWPASRACYAGSGTARSLRLCRRSSSRSWRLGPVVDPKPWVDSRSGLRNRFHHMRKH